MAWGAGSGDLCEISGGGNLLLLMKRNVNRLKKTFESDRKCSIFIKMKCPVQDQNVFFTAAVFAWKIFNFLFCFFWGGGGKGDCFILEWGKKSQLLQISPEMENLRPAELGSGNR